MEESSRSLRRVVERFPRPVYSTHTFGARLYKILIIERLECGHELTIFWQADNLTAKWRTCPKCAEFPAGASSPKKPAMPERDAQRRSQPGRSAA